MKENLKKYQLWLNYGPEGWQYTAYDTLDEALAAERNTSRWVITKSVTYKTEEIND